MSNLEIRLRTILEEQNLKQVEFAKMLDVSPNYIYLLVNGKKLNISIHLAKRIEKLYGYSSEWIMFGQGNKLISTNLSPLKMKIIHRIHQLNEKELNSLLAFIELVDDTTKII